MVNNSVNMIDEQTLPPKMQAQTILETSDSVHKVSRI